MFDWLAIAAIVIVYATEYIVSLYSLAVYIDPDEVHIIFPNVSKRHREFLKRLVADPRAFIQIATVYKSLALIVIVVLATFVFRSLAVGAAPDTLWVYPLGYLLLWLLQVFCVEYLARRSSRKAVRNKMPKYLWLITMIFFLLYPVVAAYRRLLNRTHRREQVTEEEKEDIVERAIESLADQAGIGEVIVEKNEKEMIGRIFLLDQTVVREIMVPRIDITGIEKSMNVREIQRLVLDDGHSRFPVFEETIDRVIGILYVKDLFSNMPRPEEPFEIARYLRRPFFVPESKVIGELLREFQAKKQHLAVVVDEYGGVAGLVTLEDILEEVFGEIQDEHDTETAEFVRLPDGRYLVDAGLMVDRLQDYLDTEYDQGDYDTVGGLIYDLVEAVPKEGTKVRWHDLTFEITSVEGQRIKSVTVEQRGRNGAKNPA